MSYADGFSNVPRPVFAHGLVSTSRPDSSSRRCWRCGPDGTGDVTKTHVGVELNRGAPLTPSPLVVGDELYVVTDGGIATCLDARTGAIVWQQRLGGTYSASPVFAGGQHILSGRAGRDHGHAAGQGVSPAGHQSPRWRAAGVDGRLRRLIIPAD